VTRLLLVKLARDLRAVRGRVALMVLALTVSLVAFGTILSTRSIIGEQIGVSYLSTDPASATLVLAGGVDPAQLAAVRAEAREQPGIVDATLRSQLTVQLRSAGGGLRPEPLQLFVAAADDPMRIGRYPVERGAWPPPDDGVLLERNALAFLGLQVGDHVDVLAPDGSPASLRVTGVVHDPSLAPAYEERKGYGYVTTAALARLGARAALDELKIVVADRPGGTTATHDRDTVVRAATALATILERTRGLRVQQVQVPPPYEHPHQRQMAALLLAVLLFGATSLVLSAVLVANMVDGLLTRQVPQIGVLKAVGAGQGRVLALYLAMTVLIAAAATAIAYVPALLLGRAYARLLLGAMLNMDAPGAAAPWWTSAALVVTGGLLPPLVALPPLVRASRTTVRAAIDHGGVAAGPGATRLDAWLGRLRGLDRTLLAGLRNAVRRRARLALTAGILATAGGLFIGGLSTVAGVEAVPDTMAAEQRWDVDVRLAAPASASTLGALAAGVPHVTRAEAWTVVPSGVQHPGQVAVTNTWPDQGHGSISVAGVPAGTAVLTPPPLIEGRWLRPDDTDAVVLNQLVRGYALPGVHAGDAVELSIGGRSTSWRVVGVVREPFAGTCPCVTAAGLARATGRPDEANGLRVLTDAHDPATRAAVAEAVERALAGAGVRVQSSRAADWLGAVADGHLFALASVVLAIAAVMGLVGLLGLGSTMSAGVLERTRELGTMHAIGVPASAVRRIVVSEGVFTGLASCAAAVVLGLALTAVLGTAVGQMMLSTPLPFRFSAGAVVAWVVAILLGATLATLAPALRASRLTVREALAQL
jgi:putative ABC transport system permease protein